MPASAELVLHIQGTLRFLRVGGCSSLYTKKYIITILASGCGPLLSLVLFWRLGNQWEPSDCRHVLLWGLGLLVVPLVVMCCFDDSKALEHHHTTNGEAAR